MWYALGIIVVMATGSTGVRDVTATSCEVIPLNLALGMTTQLTFESKPLLTLHADEQHFKIVSHKEAERSIAIIPHVQPSEISQLLPDGPRPNYGARLAEILTTAFRTNLFVFFEGSTQLMFEMRFVPKEKADYVVRIRHLFKPECSL